jgi:hypothetical protein
MLRFEAEVANAARLAWAEDAWGAILSRKTIGISAGTSPLGQAYARPYGRFMVRELSVTAVPADAGARILRAWSREPVLYLNQQRSSVIEHWRDSRASGRTWTWGRGRA